MRKIFGWLFRLYGWKVGPDLPKEVKRAVVIAAPHTSNWDLVFCLGALDRAKIKARFTIKKEWIRFPFGGLMRSAGALGIDRSPKKPGEARRSMVEAMAALFEEHDELAMCITPEGTRKRVPQWHLGFYHVALQAGVPILLGYVDYKTKQAGIGGVIEPHPDKMDEHMRQIMDFYRTKQPRFPAKFSLDERYS